MITDPFPVRSYREAGDARADWRVLEAAGIQGEVRTESPPGWRLGGDLPFTIWVHRRDLDRAIALLRASAPPPALCDRCQNRPATVHVTEIRDASSRRADLCVECYREIPGSKEPGLPLQ